MKKFLFVLTILILPVLLFAQEKEINPLYTLPKVSLDDKERVTTQVVSKGDSNKPILATESGIYRVINSKTIYPLWTDGKAKQILRIEKPQAQNKAVEVFYFVTSKGILFSKDLKTFESKNEGLPVLTIKKYDGKNTTFEKQVADIKDISFNPEKPEQMVCATKDKVYISENGGETWTYFSAPKSGTSGLKAVAVATIHSKKNDGTEVTEDYVFCSH